MRAGLGISGDPAGIVVGGAGDDAGTEPRRPLLGGAVQPRAKALARWRLAMWMVVLEPLAQPVGGKLARGIAGRPSESAIGVPSNELPSAFKTSASVLWAT